MGHFYHFGLLEELNKIVPWKMQLLLFSSVNIVQLCDPMDCSRSDFPVHHYLPEFAQTHVHWVDAIQPSHPLSSPSPPALSLFQHQGFFQWVSSLHHSQSIEASASVLVLPVNIQDWFPLGLTGLFFLQSKELSSVFSSTSIQKHQFFSAQPSFWSSSHICI